MQELIQILFGRDFTLIPGLERINGLRCILQWREFQREGRVGESATSRDIYKIHLTAIKLPSVKKQAAPCMKVYWKNFIVVLPRACAEQSVLSNCLQASWLFIFKSGYGRITSSGSKLQICFSSYVKLQVTNLQSLWSLLSSKTMVSDTNSASIIHTQWLLLYLLKKCILFKKVCQVW